MLTGTGIDILRDIILFCICLTAVYVGWNVLALVFSKVLNEIVIYREYRARKQFVKEIEENRNACN